MTDIFQHRYYRINKFYLSCIGLWPYQSRRRRFLLLAFIFSIAVLTVPPLITVTLEFRNDPEMMAECTTPILTFITFFIRLVTMIASSNKTLKIFRSIEMDWKSVDRNPAIHILHDYAERGRKFTIAYSVGMYSVAILYGSRPVVPRILELMKLTNETLPKTLLFPVDYYGLDRDTYYYFIMALEYIGTMICIVVIITADTTLIIQVEHACGMFAVVGYQLQRMANGISEECTNYSHPKLDPACKKLTVCIAKHRDVIEFCKILEASITWYFFISVGIAMVSISYAGVQTVFIMNINPKQAVCYVTIVITFAVALFFNCFFAQRLSDHSKEIGEFIRQAEWYNTSLVTQKLLNLVTMRTYAPCQLTAGKFMVLSLENFAVVLKGSLSYFTVMRSMQ